MNGPEHYAEAERLLEKARMPSYIVTLPDSTPMNAIDRIKNVLAERGLDDNLIGTESVRIDVTPFLLAAQVHATLALAAAQALDSLGGIDGEPLLARNWQRAVS